MTQNTAYDIGENISDYEVNSYVFPNWAMWAMATEFPFTSACQGISQETVQIPFCFSSPAVGHRQMAFLPSH